jgi:hypothetical protein
MKPSVFFDNCHVFFEDADDDKKFVDIPASLYRNEDGEILEIRFFNQTYDEFMTIDRDGRVSFVSIPEEELEKLPQKSLGKKK